MQHTNQLACELLQVAHVRITYMDSEGDACTLTEETVKDAVCFTKPGSHDEQPRVLELEASHREETQTPLVLSNSADMQESTEAETPETPAQPGCRNLACASPSCNYSVHSSPKFGSYCCKGCQMSPGTHGPRCEQRHAPDGTARATSDAAHKKEGKEARQGTW